MSEDPYVAEENVGMLVHNIRKTFKDWYINGVPQPRSRVRQLLGLKAKRVKIPTDYPPIWGNHDHRD